MRIIYLIVLASIILLVLVALLYKKWSSERAQEKAPAQVSSPKQKSVPCNPTIGESRPRAANYYTDETGKCVPTGCMSGFTKNSEGKCVVLRKFNWII